MLRARMGFDWAQSGALVQNAGMRVCYLPDETTPLPLKKHET